MPWPTPCSPVQVPPKESARSPAGRGSLAPATAPPRRPYRSAAAHGSCRRPHRPRSARAAQRSECPTLAATQTASAEIGTHTSVTAPRRRASTRAPPNRRRGAPATAGCGPPFARRKQLPSPFRPRDTGEGFEPALAAEAVPWNSRNSVSILGQMKMRIGVAGGDVNLVDKLDTGERKAHLQRDDHGVAGALDRTEGTTADSTASGWP